MARRSEFVEHITETLRLFGPVTVRGMFGGWGLYHEGVFFALVAGDTLYLKADDGNRGRFEALGLEPFSFESRSRGETVITSYRRAPDEALEDAQVMAEWAREAYGAALRVAAARRVKAKPSTRKPARKTSGKAT